MPVESDDGLAGRADVAEQMVVGERGRGDLMDRRVEGFDEVDGGLVPGRDEPVDFDGLAEGGDLGVVFLLEFEAVFEVAVGGSEGIFAGFGEFVGGVDDIDGSLLELDSVAACGDGDADEPFGKVDVAVMVDADFCDDVAGLTIAHQFVSDLQCAHRNSPIFVAFGNVGPNF